MKDELWQLHLETFWWEITEGILQFYKSTKAFWLGVRNAAELLSSTKACCEHEQIPFVLFDGIEEHSAWFRGLNRETQEKVLDWLYDAGVVGWLVRGNPLFKHVTTQHGL